MEQQQALDIIRQLANGTDPQTGRPFPPDTPWQHPDTVRALFFALQAIEPKPAPAGTAKAKPVQPPPANSGKPWSDAEDDALGAAFDAGRTILDLALEHKRSRFAIETRLAKLGKLPPPAGARGYARPAAGAPQAAAH